MNPDSVPPTCAPVLARHRPVLLAETLEYLQPKAGDVFVDATLGGGGHARAIAESLGPSGRLIGLDQDPKMHAFAKAKLATLTAPPRFDFFEANFRELSACLEELGVRQIDGLMADLGFASDQLESAERGLSFGTEGPLDMRLSPTAPQTAADILAGWSERDLADVFWRYGEERYSRRIARRIVEVRKKKPLHTTTELAELVRSCVPRSPGLRIDPATRVFQALRIVVNDELEALETLLACLPALVAPMGRVVLISFHSLEDRAVKFAFRQREHWEILTKKPIEAGPEERAENPRSRSAKLRAAQRKGTP